MSVIRRGNKMLYESQFKEAIEIPLEKNQVFKHGKFKNKSAVYDHHYINDKGDLIIVTDKGKEVNAMKIRLSVKEARKNFNLPDMRQ